MEVFNPRNVLDLLLEDYKSLKSTTPTESGVNMKNTIKGLLEDCEAQRCEIEEQDTTLCNDEISYTRSGGEKPSAASSTPNESAEDTADEDVCPDPEKDPVDLNYKRKAVEFWKSSKKKKRRDLRSVQTKFKKVTSTSQLQRWEQAVQNSGTTAEKYAAIDEIVKKKFEEAQNENQVVHDIDLQAWGIQASQDILPNFKASPNWVAAFKARHSIGSRKITKFVTRTQIAGLGQMRTTIAKFVEEVRFEIMRVGPENTYNSDQSGISIEMCPGRTLHSKGVKKVNAVVQRVNSTTHTFTVQPILNANGKFLQPMLVVLQEANGVFGPIVEKNLFQAPNLKLVPSRSGKCSSAILKTWYSEIFLPKVSADSIILLDAFGGFNAATNSRSNNADDYSEDENAMESEHNVKVHRIPQGTTGYIQPLDVYGFRPYKNLLRRISDKIRLHNLDFELGVRNNIIKLQSLVFNILCSPRFHEMFKYGWYKSGYIDVHPAPFHTPVEYCFPQFLDPCEKCQAAGFIRCSWCSESLCFQHFIQVYHLCEIFVE